jgi:hypothetical protein
MVVLARIAKATVEAAKKVKINGTFLQQALAPSSEEVFDHVYSDRYREVGKAFGFEAVADKNHSHRDWQSPLEEFTEDSPLARLVLTFCADNFGEHSAAKVRATAKFFKVDVARIEKEAQEEVEARTQDELARAKKAEPRRKEVSERSPQGTRSTNDNASQCVASLPKCRNGLLGPLGGGANNQQAGCSA